jgi:hypothetical protein
LVTKTSLSVVVDDESPDEQEVKTKAENPSRQIIFFICCFVLSFKVQ